MTTYVLVHGAWHGAWCWQRVRPPLEARGHQVITPDLTGLGERRSEVAPDVGLGTHVADVGNLIERADLSGIVLVGHSYAGLVVRQVADRHPQRVAHLGLVDAWIAADGESMLDVVPDRLAAWTRDGASSNGDGWLVPPPPPGLVGVDDPEDVEWLTGRMDPQPLLTFDEPSSISGRVDAVNGTAIACTPDTGTGSAELASQFGYPVVTIESGHDVMVTNPTGLTQRLLALAP